MYSPHRSSIYGITDRSASVGLTLSHKSPLKNESSGWGAVWRGSGGSDSYEEVPERIGADFYSDTAQRRCGAVEQWRVSKFSEAHSFALLSRLELTSQVRKVGS